MPPHNEHVRMDNIGLRAKISNGNPLILSRFIFFVSTSTPGSAQTEAELNSVEDDAVAIISDKFYSS
jgi:hypothetical protein